MIKVVLAGEAGCGKSALYDQLCGKPFQPSYSETRELRRESIQFSPSITADILDLGGRHIRSDASRYFSNAHLVLLTYDTTSITSFEEATSRWAVDAQRLCPSAILALIGTKSDLSMRRAIPIKQAEAFASRHSIFFMEISSKDNINISLTLKILGIRLATALKRFGPISPLSSPTAAQSAKPASALSPVSAMPLNLDNLNISASSPSSNTIQQQQAQLQQQLQHLQQLQYLQQQIAQQQQQLLQQQQQQQQQQHQPSIPSSSSPSGASIMSPSSAAALSSMFPSSVFPSSSSSSSIPDPYSFLSSSLAPSSSLLSLAGPPSSLSLPSDFSNSHASQPHFSSSLPSNISNRNIHMVGEIIKTPPTSPPFSHSISHSSSLLLPSSSSSLSLSSISHDEKSLQRAVSPPPKNLIRSPPPQSFSGSSSLGSSTPNSSSNSKVINDPLLYIDISVGDGRTGQVCVREGDSPQALAEAFVRAFRLDKSFTKKLAILITQRIHQNVPNASWPGLPNDPSQAAASVAEVQEISSSSSSSSSSAPQFPQSSISASRIPTLSSIPSSSNNNSNEQAYDDLFGGDDRRRTPRPFRFATEERAHKSRGPDNSNCLMKLHIDIGRGKFGTISVRKGDDPMVLARSFVQTFALRKDFAAEIADRIREQLATAELEERMAERELEIDLGPLGRTIITFKAGESPLLLARRLCSSKGLAPGMAPKLSAVIAAAIDGLRNS